MKNNKQSNSYSKKEKQRIIMATAGILCIIIGFTGLLLFGVRRCTKDDNPDNGFIMDDNAVEGGWNKVDEDKVRENLNAGVEEGYINISMNTTPVFENGQSEGNLMIVNESINKYPQKVIITRNDNGDVIYESKGIPVGSKIEKAMLSDDLPAGTYECTAMFHNVNPDTGESLGCAGAIIQITVKN